MSCLREGADKQRVETGHTNAGESAREKQRVSWSRFSATQEPLAATGEEKVGVIYLTCLWHLIRASARQSARPFVYLMDSSLDTREPSILEEGHQREEANDDRLSASAGELEPEIQLRASKGALGCWLLEAKNNQFGRPRIVVVLGVDRLPAK